MIKIFNPFLCFIQRQLNLFYGDVSYLNIGCFILLSIGLVPNAYSEEETKLLAKVQFANLKQLSQEHGLSENTVNQIYQDQQGFIWLATELGINRYDGYRIKNLTGVQSTLADKSISQINQDSVSNYWIATANGLSIFDESLNEIRMSKFPSSAGQQNNANHILGSIEISEGISWIVTWNGLYRYDINNTEISQPLSMELFQTSHLNLLSYYADKNRIWLGTSQGIYIFNPSNKKLTKFLSDSKIDELPIYRLKLFAEESLFLTSNRGFYRLNFQKSPETEKSNKVPLDRSILKISNRFISDFILSNNDEQNKIIYSTKDAIYSFELKSERLSKLFSLNDVLPNTAAYRITTLFLDSQSLLWIGTRNRGAYIWDSKTQDFTVLNSNALDKSYRINDNKVWSIDQGANGNYWVGTSKGLNSIDAKSFNVNSPYDFNQPEILDKQAKIYDLFQNGDSLWLATANDLSHLNITTQKLEHLRPTWLEEKDKFIVFSLTSITNDTLWLGTNIGTLKFDMSLNQFNYEKLLSLRNNKKMTRYITQINGQILTSTENGVLVYSPKSGLQKSLLPPKRNAKGSLYSLTDVLYINNQLWLSYDGDGIYIIENNELKTFLSEDESDNLPFNQDKIIHLGRSSGFPDDSVYSLEMSHQYVWATTNTGLIRIRPKNLSHSIFDSNFGLPNNEFNEGASLLANNHLFYGGPNGITIINPEKLAPLNEILQTPKITKITLTQNGKVKELTFPSDAIPEVILSKNTLLFIEMTVLNFRTTKNLEFEYWFKGKEHLLKQQSKRPEIFLANLKPGHYSLRIKASSKYYLDDSKTLHVELMVKDDLMLDEKIKLIIFALVIILLIFSIVYLFRKNTKDLQLLSKLTEGEKRLENALLDKDRGIWELNISPDIPTELIVFQESHTPMGLTLERYFDYIHKNDLEKIKMTWLDFSHGRIPTISETYRVYFHGELIWNYIHGKITSYNPDGTPLRGSGIWVNVDEEKKVEERLNSFSHAFESTLDIVFILDNNLIVTAVNQAYEISTGFICERMIGRSMVDIAFSRFTTTETNAIKKKVIQNKHWKGESSIPRRNASSFPVDIRVNLITKDGQDNGYVVVMSDISESKGTRSENFGNRFYDQVTGLPNKVLALDRLREIMKRSEENKRSFSLILLGIEHLEQLKKQLRGSSFSDLFKLLSARILPYIDRDDVFARFDETQFIIILHHRLGDEETISTINQLIAETLKPFEINEIKYHISVQAGISKFPDDGGNWSELVTKAQLALEKTTKRNSNLQKNMHFSYFQESRNKRAIERNEIERKLSKAIEKNELFLVFQPIVDINSHVMLDAEVSFRWQMGKDKIIYHTQVLSIASEIGMLTKITNWMISNTMASLHRWNQEELQINLSVNLSSQYLLSDQNLTFISQSLIDNDINPADITVSVNEDCLRNDTPQLSDSINRLEELGIALMLSEFAKDNAPLQKIQTYNFSSVRFDKALIRKIGRDQFSELILGNMMSVINQLGIKSIASGVENEIQESFLLKLKCQFAQGYLYSDPLTENQMRQLMLDKQG